MGLEGEGIRVRVGMTRTRVADAATTCPKAPSNEGGSPSRARAAPRNSYALTANGPSPSVWPLRHRITEHQRRALRAIAKGEELATNVQVASLVRRGLVRYTRGFAGLELTLLGAAYAFASDR